ncbi:MAG TPA: flavin reductase family protein [Alphaproteobacteria bacterium]|nr:flavin reductase family protein [Alphaproteobacteria bacterium]
MFYDPERRDHGLPHNPFKSLVVPRPIGWISTLSREGVVNLAPYSYFNAVCDRPPTVMFASGGARARDRRKDSQRNAEETGEFVVNLATWDLREKVSATSATLPSEVDEMALCGLASLPSIKVKPPRVAESPIHLECRYLLTVPVPESDPAEASAIVIGRVIGVHIRDDVIVDGRVDPRKFKPIARLGYFDYTVVDSFFTIPFPE